MIRIGIVGENFKNDSVAIGHLLNKQFGDKAVFIPLLKTFSGKGLENVRKVIESLKSEVRKKKIDIVILVRDLDGLLSEDGKIKRIEKWAKIIKEQSNINQLVFLVIFELEALILSDIPTFNQLYKTNYQLKTSSKFQTNPKELLKQITRKSKRKYKESDTPEIFQQFNFQNIYQNHQGAYSFQSFIDELTTTLN